MSRRRRVTFADLLNPAPYHWPSAGDRLFVPATGRAESAEIHKDGQSRLQLMTNGYQEAADILIEEAIADHMGRSVLIYPIIFCCRHYLELALKGFVEFYGGRVGIPAPKRGHDLKDLLRGYRKMLRAFDVSKPQGADITVSKCILEFHRFDPASFAFRYPKGRDNEPYPIKLGSVDLRRLQGTMKGVANYFEGTDAYLFEMVSNAVY